MELKAGDLSKILIFIFILLVGLVGTYIEFRKPKNKNEEKNFDLNNINKIIKEEIEKDENSNF